MVPHLAVHVTGMFALNCCVCPCGVFADAGVMTIAKRQSLSPYCCRCHWWPFLSPYTWCLDRAAPSEGLTKIWTRSWSTM